MVNECSLVGCEVLSIVKVIVGCKGAVFEGMVDSVDGGIGFSMLGLLSCPVSVYSHCVSR